MKKNIKVVHLTKATAVNSTNSLLTFDAVSGNSMNLILCCCFFPLPEGFLDEITASKIVQIDMRDYEAYKHGCSFYLTPVFGYTNQKLEDVLCRLFEKYEL